MTDTFGSEPQNPQEEKDASAEPAAVEGDVAQESQDTTTEPTSEEEQNYEFSDKDLPEDPAGAEPLRRSPFLPIAAAVGGILLLGSVAWWQLTGGTSFSLPPPITKTVSGGFSLPSLPPTTPVETTVAASPIPAEPKTDSVSQKEPDVPAALPSEASSSVRPSLSDTPLPQAKPVEAASESAPATVVPAPAVEATPAALPAPAPVAAVPTPADDRKIETLTARIDSLQKALDLANQQVGQMTTALAAASSAQTAVKELQAKNEKLEQKLATSAATTPADTPTATAAPGTTTEEAAPAPKAKTATPAKPKAAHKAAHKTSKPAAAKASSGLVLRAVSSGHAWIAKSAASTDLTEIMVGDKVSGLGTITAIEEHGGVWVVRGTKGVLQ